MASQHARPLEGRVALVTGASKNIGKGMALEVAAAGARTYVTARTLGESAETPGSLCRTVAEIEAAGGTAVALACDHADDAQVESVFERIAAEQGRLDVLVNVASPDFSEMVGVPFWEIPFQHISACLDIGPRSGYVTTALAARMMVPQGSGVVINISSHGARQHLLSVPYGMGKAAIDKLTQDTAAELRAHGVAVVSLWPGLVLTEGLLANAEVAPDGSRTLHGLDIGFGETPKFNGKAVVALAADARILERSGGSFWSSRLAREYGFAEDDGSLPPEIEGLQSMMAADDIPDFWRGVERYAAP
jgi:NAD(P)-dependent dehydrogenase (short-subunit alcohol dehydrogenase family)